MKTKKESSTYNIALVHFLTSIVLNTLISFIVMFITASMFELSRRLLTIFPLILWCIFALITLYSAHYINTTYVVTQPRKVVRASVAYYTIALIVLSLFFKDPQYATSDANIFSVCVTLAIFYSVSHWKIKSDVVTQ